MRTRRQHSIEPGILLALVVAVATVGPAPAQAAPTPPTTTAPCSAPALDPEIDRILTRLEQREVHDLHANVAWRERYVIDAEEDATTKTGEIWYQQAQPVARFLIRFTKRISAGGRSDALDEQHLFDGQWYVELQSRTKTYTRREVRRPDDPGDPYKVGQGVFPLPFGQKKADILREFTVTRLPQAEGDPPATDHLRLVPRAETRTGETYQRLDFWVAQEGRTAGLPIKVQVAKKDGTGKVNSYITITFTDARLNESFNSGVFEIKVPAGYETIEERLEPAAPPPAFAPQTP